MSTLWKVNESKNFKGNMRFSQKYNDNRSYKKYNQYKKTCISNPKHWQWKAMFIVLSWVL